jgi:hypothetical protein
MYLFLLAIYFVQVCFATQAIPADSLVDSIGINTHLGFAGLLYECVNKRMIKMIIYTPAGTMIL